MKQNTLSTLLKKEYLKSIILPLLLIEVMLLLAYFWSNAYVNETSKHALIEETKIHIKEISKRSATLINNEFKTLSNLTMLMQKQHEAFFENYNPLHVKEIKPTYRMLKDGVIANTETNENSCSLFFSNVKQTNSYRMEKAIATEVLDSFYNALIQSNENIAQVYFNSHDSMNRLCPFMPDALSQYPHNMNIPTYNFYYLADTKHNPLKTVIWTDAYLDPAGQGWMISAIAPVYKGDFLEGVVGIDVTIVQLIRNILTIKLPYASMAMLVDENGHILGMSEALEPHLGIKELTSHTYHAPIEATISKPQDFNLFTHKDNALARLLTQMIETNNDISEFGEARTHFIITQNAIAQTKWKFILLLDKDDLLANSTTLKEKTDTIGYIALGFMALFYLIFLFVLLKRAQTFSNEILMPLYELIEATKILKNKLAIHTIQHSNIIEINTLLDNFTAMSHELQELYDSMERKIKEGVTQKMEAQKMMIYQSRLAQMGEMISMIAHQWRQPLGSIAALAASIKLKNDLKKFDLSSEHGRAEQKEFLNTSVQKIEHYILFLTTTIDDFRNFFKPDQQAKETSLAQAIEKALSILSKSLEEHQIVLHVKITSTTLFSSYETQIVQVLINILKNAHDVIVERKIAQGEIWIHAYEEKQSEETFFMVEIEYNAGGVKPSIMDKIFDPYFSTKLEKNGTGLGLYMAKTIIEEHCHGSLYVENTQKGAKFTLKIRGEYHVH